MRHFNSVKIRRHNPQGALHPDLFGGDTHQHLATEGLGLQEFLQFDIDDFSDAELEQIGRMSHREPYLSELRRLGVESISEYIQYNNGPSRKKLAKVLDALFLAVEESEHDGALRELKRELWSSRTTSKTALDSAVSSLYGNLPEELETAVEQGVLEEDDVLEACEEVTKDTDYWEFYAYSRACDNEYVLATFAGHCTFRLQDGDTKDLSYFELALWLDDRWDERLSGITEYSDCGYAIHAGRSHRGQVEITCSYYTEFEICGTFDVIAAATAVRGQFEDQISKASPVEKIKKITARIPLGKSDLESKGFDKDTELRLSKPESPSRPVYLFSDGSYVEDCSPDDLPMISSRTEWGLGICAGLPQHRYIHHLKTGKCVFWILRKKDGRPLLCINADTVYNADTGVDDLVFDQIKGKGNRLPGFGLGGQHAPDSKFRKEEVDRVVEFFTKYVAGDDEFTEWEELDDLAPAMKRLKALKRGRTFPSQLSAPNPKQALRPHLHCGYCQNPTRNLYR